MVRGGSSWFMFCHGSWWFVMVRHGSCFVMVRGGSSWFMFCHGSWWFVMVRHGSCFVMVCVVVRSGLMSWFVVVRSGS